MASSHRRYAGWTVVRIRQEAAAIGPATSALRDLILDERSHSEQGLRACLGCCCAGDRHRRAHLWLGQVNHLDRRPAHQRSADDARILHANIRGPRYYNWETIPYSLTHPTFDRPSALGLHGMAKAFADIEATGEAANLGHAEWLALSRT